MNALIRPFPSPLLLGALLPLGFAHPALSQAVEEIVVSADYRQSSVNDIPASVTVLDDELMHRKNAQHLEDILLQVPNVNFASGASRARFYQIRGIGERGQFGEPLNPSVGLIIDGVDFSGMGNAALLYDVEQVEVLLGPQGTRYGSNALAGLINLQSRAPTDEFTVGLHAQAANYDSRGIAGYVSGPLGSPKLSYRLAGQKRESDGFSRNLFLGRATNTRNESSYRAKIRWLATPDVTLDLTAARINLDNGYDAFSVDNIRDTLSDEPGVDNQDSKLVSARLVLDGFQAFAVEAIGGYGDSGVEYGYDEDWVYVGFHPDAYSSTDYYYRDRNTVNAELRLLSKDDGALFGGTTDYVAGLYTLQQEESLLRVYTWLPADFTSDYDIGRLAAYAETSTALGAGWSLDLGLRAERFDADYADAGALAFSPREDLHGGKLALTYTAADGNLLYASASRGYKTGGFNTDGSLDDDLREFGSERLWNYELGYKGLLLDDRLQARAALFSMDRDDVQISSSQVRLRDDGSSEFIAYTGNAAAGVNYGLEISADWLASDFLRLYGSLGLLETEYRNFINSAGEDLDGREQAHAPNYQYTLGADFLLAPTLALNLNLQGRDAFYFSDSHDARSQPYALVDASLDYQLDEWRFTLWGRNLANEEYQVRGFYFGNDPRKDFADEVYTQLGEPRRYGLTVDYTF